MVRWPFVPRWRYAAQQERLRLMSNCAGVVQDLATSVLEMNSSVVDVAGARERLRDTNDYLHKISVMAKFILEHAAGTAPKQVIPPALQPKKEGQRAADDY